MPRRPYFSGNTLLFSLSERQHQILRSPPLFDPAELTRHDARSLTILARNGLILIAGGQVSVTEPGRVAGHLYDLLRRVAT